MSKESYIEKMTPWAKKAEIATGLPYHFIVAQWGWETGWGTNRGALHLNNHSGIKYSKYAPPGTVQDGMYSKYNSMDSYIKDYARVMGLSYYTKIRNAKTDIDRIKELNASPYSETDYNIDTMLSAQKIARKYGEGITVPDSPSIPQTPTSPKAPTLPNLNLGEMDMEQYAILGLALFTVMLSMSPRRSSN